MDWLKDKKNLPIVIGMAVFFLLAAGGLIAFELGAFSGNAATTTVASSGPPAPSPAAPSPAASPGPPPGPAAAPGARTPAAPGAKTLASPGSKPSAASALLNPKTGPDPFNIPGGQKTLSQRAMASSVAGTNGAPLALRDILPKFDLFTVPAPAASPALVPTPTPSGTAPANLKVIGTVNSAGSIYAILEVNGQAQSPAKPGDTLPDGTKVVSIQPTGVTIRAGDGTTATLPLTTGSGSAGGPAPDQTNGQPGQPQNPDTMSPPGFPGQ